MTALLEAAGLRASYGPTEVLHGIDFAIAEGGIAALLGANGAGKTTTLRAVCGMVERHGVIRWLGQRIDGKTTEDIVRLGVAHVPEGRGTFVNLSVEENLRVGAYIRRDRGAVARDVARMYAYFPKLAERRRQQAGTLSGGEQQMLAIARALMLRPRLLVLDEPSFGLGPLIVASIFEIMESVRREERIAILLVEQNVALALELADHAYLLETGRVAMAGTAEALRRNEQVRRSYLGF
jgi:branched-chain amino acid transport system ATP-binding protein